VHVTPVVKDYTTPVVCKNSLTDFSSVSNPTLVVSKCSSKVHARVSVSKVTLHFRKSKKRHNKIQDTISHYIH